MDVGDPAAAGHFTTMQVRDGAVQGLDLHLARLCAANRRLYHQRLDEAALRARIRAVLAGGPGRDACTLRVLVRPGGGPGAAAGLEEVGIELQPPRTAPVSPLRLCSHRGLRACPELKHLALRPQLDARAAAQAAGFDDALLVDADGRIAEGTFWNLLLWDGTTATWPQAPILEGVTQQLVRAGLVGAGVPQRQLPVALDGLAGMRAAFALNSSGVRAIASIDDHGFERDAGFAALLRDLLARCPWQRP